MTRVFVYIAEFEKQCEHLGLTEKDIEDIEDFLLTNPTAGNMIPGTGGVRKVRIRLPNRGKRGGARIVYVDFTHYKKMYMLTVYSKGVKENLTQAEKSELKNLVNVLKAESRNI
ncbi:MAG: type II toxin-antitoxin system RelE/ParE family toxin [Oscillospiraceae bacterium]|nr:type II toxin-antitoxin system RelE/ParE family toxin [Oscillospiraceae bacterium]